MKLALSFFILFLSQQFALADTITLISGKTIEGQMTGYSETDVTITGGGATRKVPFRLIETILPTDSEGKASLIKAKIVEAFNQNRAKANQKKLALLEKVQKKKVELFMTTWCPYCKRMEQFFIERGVKYTKCDIEHDIIAKKTFDAFGGKGVPVVRINGSIIIRGYVPNKVWAALVR